MRGEPDRLEQRRITVVTSGHPKRQNSGRTMTSAHDQQAETDPGHADRITLTVRPA